MSSETPFNLLIAYLNGKTDAGKLRAAFTHGTQTEDAFAAYKNTKITPLQEQTLKTALGVPSTEELKADNLLEWIDNLNKARYGYGQLADFRHILKQIHPKTDWSGTLLFTGAAIFSTLVLYTRQSLLVGFQVYTILQQAYKTWYDDTFYTNNHRTQRWLVGTLPAVLNLSAYLAIAVAGSMSPIAATLFVAASVVAVVDGALRFYHLHAAGNQPESDPASAARQKNREERSYQTLKVKMYAAVALSAVVAISCVFPPTIFVILSCTALFILMTKNIRLDKIHTDSSNQLLVSLSKCTKETSTLSKHTVEHNEALEVDNREPNNSHAIHAKLSEKGIFAPQANNPTLALPEVAEAKSLNTAHAASPV